MNLLKFLNYDELIEFCELWTSWTMNYAMNSNCDMVNCCEGSKVLCLYLCVRGMNVWRQ